MASEKLMFNIFFSEALSELNNTFQGEVKNLDMIWLNHP
jgi:hypothetical protein